MQNHCRAQWNACEATDVDMDAQSHRLQRPMTPTPMSWNASASTNASVAATTMNAAAHAEAGDDQARREVDAVSSCVQENECRDDECARRNCENEIEAQKHRIGRACEPVEPEEPVEPADEVGENDQAAEIEAPEDADAPEDP